MQEPFIESTTVLQSIKFALQSSWKMMFSNPICVVQESAWNSPIASCIGS